MRFDCTRNPWGYLVGVDLRSTTLDVLVDDLEAEHVDLDDLVTAIDESGWINRLRLPVGPFGTR